MAHEDFAKKLLKNVGTESNMVDLYHCITRIRIVVADKSKVDIEKIEAEEVVKKAQFKGNELQIVIGPNVRDVYQPLEKLVNKAAMQKDAVLENDKNILTKLVDFLSGVFVPVLPALVAGGMAKSISTLLTMSGLVTPGSDISMLLTIIDDSVFYFLPFFIALSSARILKTNAFLSLLVAGSLMYPTLTHGLESGAGALSIFGVSIPILSYSATVFPIIFGVLLLSYVYRFLEDKIHKNVRMIFAPVLAVFIVIPITLAFLAPLGHYIGIYLAQILTWIFGVNGVIASMITGALIPLIVMAGMHQSLFPLMLNNLAENGFDVLLPIFYLQTLAIAGSTFAVFVTSKDMKQKSAALSTGISAFFGITEPALYGINIPLKKPLIATLIASGIGNGLAHFLGVRAFAFGLPSFFSIPTYVNTEAGSSLGSVIISSVVTMGLAFALSYVFMVRDKKEEAAAVVEEAIIENVVSPMDAGTILELSELEDDVFAKELLGPTVAIKPANGEIYAPVDGIITLLTDTKHAVGLTSKDGLEVLIHIGIDTVKLNGEPFTSHVERGDTVRKGDLITQVDLDYLAKRNVNDTVIIVVTNDQAINKKVNVESTLTKETILFQK